MEQLPHLSRSKQQVIDRPMTTAWKYESLVQPGTDASMELDVHLAEYKSLKDEQRARIIGRDRFAHAMLGTIATVAFFASGVLVPARQAVLLLLAPAGFILGWLYLANDWKVSELRTYFCKDLSQALAECTGKPSDTLLRWETVHRNGPHRRRRKLIQVGIDLTTFCVPGLVALVVYWSIVRQWSIPLVLVSVLEAVFTVLLACEIIRGVDRPI